MTDKEFTLKYVFEGVGKLEEEKFLYSSVDEHFGMKWKANLLKQNEFLGIWLYANVNKNQEIHSDFTVNIFSKKKEEIHSKSRSCVFENANGGWDNWGWHKRNNWISEERIEKFGEEMKQFSDVTLEVKEQKFYVSKLYLSSHSPYFATLFLGKFQESEKSEIELKDVDPQDFQCYLEVLYGENGIDDDTVEGILSVADMFDTSLIVKKCEDFLVKESRMELKKKLELGGNYRLEELRKLCLDEINSKDDIRSVIAEDPSGMDPKILAELLKKSLDFN
ncbi:hypothetical protein B9Z55_007475 [Caenorhabditis nigoni]|uniref:BTB domain-containing protein n=1 Tax=Caenorhabditis nigoni TaxID=1611254 RepID=A0A2G5V9S8_9PELO|nr:hypothetical protein B9Z55_007475 [Caenorhabditis nigoni]